MSLRIKQEKQDNQKLKAWIDKRENKTLNIWRKVFEGKSNNNDVISLKAVALAAVLANTVRCNIESFKKFGKNNNDNNKKENLAILSNLFLETASIYAVFVSAFIDSPYSTLNDEKKKIFLQKFYIFLFDTTPKKNNPKIAVSIIHDRMDKYLSLPFYIKENGIKYPRKGTVLWEFADKVKEIMKKEENIEFNEMVNSTILREINDLQLEKLINLSQHSMLG